MSLFTRQAPLKFVRSLSLIGVLATGLFSILSIYTLQSGIENGTKLVGIGWVAFVAMAAAIPLGRRSTHRRPHVLVWGYGVAAGAMITSATIFLIPQAVGQHPQWGGVGVGFGLLAGFASHTGGHWFAHAEWPVDRTVAELSVHALSAGAIIGIIYGNLPNLGILLGLSIVSHKAPAGYAAAGRLAATGRNVSIILLPATGVGIAAILSSIIALPVDTIVRATVFGFAAGVFLHVAMDFLPHCEIGSEIHTLLSASGDAHALLDRLRAHAVFSTLIGGIIVVSSWVFIT
mgnify:FL=1